MRRLSVVLLVALAVAGCKKKEPAAPQQNAAMQGAPEVGVNVKGKVVERLDAPPYSYLKLKTAEGETWVAVPKTEVANGTEVSVFQAMPMAGFESKTLKRKFDMVYFGTLGGEASPHGQPGAMAGAPAGGAPAGKGAPAAPAAMGGAPGDMPPNPAGMAAQHAAAAAGPQDVGSVKVAKATGADARTVAEIYAQKAALKEKSVTVRGKVVKFNEGIMGRNWLHIRDGSGTANKDNDITITTGDKAAVGDVVVVKGTVRLDKDFGAGYAYPVIVEDAKLSK
jgi:hypothetical protein